MTTTHVLITEKPEDVKSFVCVAEYDGGDGENGATIIRSSHSYTTDEWTYTIYRASSLFDILMESEQSNTSILADLNVRKKLMEVLNQGGGAFDLLPILYPECGYTIEHASRVSWK